MAECWRCHWISAGKPVRLPDGVSLGSVSPTPDVTELELSYWDSLSKQSQESSLYHD